MQPEVTGRVITVMLLPPNFNPFEAVFKLVRHPAQRCNASRIASPGDQ